MAGCSERFATVAALSPLLGLPPTGTGLGEASAGTRGQIPYYLCAVTRFGNTGALHKRDLAPSFLTAPTVSSGASAPRPGLSHLEVYE